jgi:hypothetical protein
MPVTWKEYPCYPNGSEIKHNNLEIIFLSFAEEHLNFLPPSCSPKRLFL